MKNSSTDITMENESKHSNKTQSAKERGKRFLEELQLQGPSNDKMGHSFTALTSKHRLK